MKFFGGGRGIGPSEYRDGWGWGEGGVLKGLVWGVGVGGIIWGFWVVWEVEGIRGWWVR